MGTLEEQLRLLEEHEEQISVVVDLVEGDYTIHLQSRDIISFKTKQEIIEISKGGKVGLMNKDCKILIPPIFDRISSYSVKHRTLIFEQTDCHKFGVATFDGQRVLEPVYDEIVYDGESFFVVRVSNQYAVLNNEGRALVDFGAYEFIDGFVNGVTRVKKEGKWGVINKYGYEFLHPEFDEIWKLKDDMSTTKVIYQGEEFYLRLDKCPSEMRGTEADYFRMSEVQVLYKYKDRKYRKLEYPEIDVYDWAEERRRKMIEEMERREWEDEVRSMRLDAFEGDEELYDEWHEN